MPITAQIKQLLQIKEFELALHLAVLKSSQSEHLLSCLRIVAIVARMTVKTSRLKSSKLSLYLSGVLTYTCIVVCNDRT